MARKTSWFDPCNICGETLCRGSKECPAAEAEKEEEFLPKKTSSSRRRIMIPSDISALLKDYKITPPERGRSEIIIRAKEDDPKITIVQIWNEGHCKSGACYQRSINRPVSLRYKNGILTRVVRDKVRLVTVA
jgi:hypothetical protein